MNSSLFAFIPHLLFWGAQAGSGIMLIALSGPPIVVLVRSLRLGDCLSARALLNSYAVVWQTIFGSSWTTLSLIQVVVLILIGLVVGMIFSEFFYQLALLLGYHKDLRLEAPSVTEDIKHFRIRCRILENENLHLHRMYEWENMQYSFTYYVEANIWTLFFVLFVYGLSTFLCSSIDRKDMVFFLVLYAVLGTLGRIFWYARRKKFESFQHCYTAIKEILKEP